MVEKETRSWSFFVPLYRNLPDDVEERIISDGEPIPSSVDVRQELFDQDNVDGKVLCPGCLRTFDQEYLNLMEVDHIVPQSRGGAHTRENVQLLCGHCNRSKQAKPNTCFLQMRTIRDWALTIRASGEEDPNDCLDGEWAYFLDLTFYLNEVQSDPELYPAFRLVDLMTLTMDALEGVIWKRRSEVVSGTSSKHFASEHSKQGVRIDITRIYNIIDH